MAGKKKSSFLSRLLITYLIAALIPLFCIISVFFYLKWQSGKREMQNTTSYAAELLSVQLEAIRDTMSFISLNIMSNEEFIPAAEGLTHEENSSYAKATDYSNMVGAISSYSYNNASYRIVFFNDEGYYMTNEAYNRNYSYTYRLPEGFIEKYDWTETARNNYGSEILLPISDSILPNVEEEGLALVRSVRNPGRVVGFLAVQLSEENLSQLLEVGELYGIELMICYKNSILYKSNDFPYDGKEVQNIADLEEALGGRYLISTVSQKDSGIHVITVSSMKSIFRKNQNDFIMTGIVGGFVVVLSLGLIAVFAHMMSRPLILVTKKMQDTTVRNLNEDIDEINKAPFREVQILYSEFYSMKQRLEVMIEKEIALMTLQTRERLRYLQAQINPHFLYNTLNIIGIMGADVGDDRIYNSCQMLSRVLKYAITEKENTFVTFEEEFLNTEMYLKLMKLRFEDKLSFSIICDDEMKFQKTIKIILQPFVENIFEHGFDADHTSLSVVIRGYMEDDTWHIIIRDNGAGMEEAALYKMKEDISAILKKAVLPGSPLEENDNIGIKNTLIRLALFYGETFKYSINNVSSGGFLITLEGKEGGPLVP